MSAIDDLFSKLGRDGRKAFMPFITAGDPDLEFTADCLRQLDAAGCHLLELGIPYSDPIADGPTIQASYTRALKAGTTLDAIFEMVGRVRSELAAPIVCMVSYAIIFRTGPAEFLRRAVDAGFSGAIVPDLTVEEAEGFAELCQQAEFSLILLITPTTPDERAAQIAARSTGFIYYVSITGITGERSELSANLVDKLESLRAKTDLPICVGFGISKPEHAKLLRPVADGLIVGSAIVRRMADVGDSESRARTLREIAEFASKMIAAVN
jgi:tryptophan synthase alpha chain